jgi:hypothetical protein
MNEHLVANVARCDRPVENWRHRFCSRAPLSLLSLEANAAIANVDGRHQLTPSFVGLRFCLAVVTPGGNDKPAVPRSTMVRGVASLCPKHDERDHCRVHIGRAPGPTLPEA